MIILFLFISLFIGINIRTGVIVGVIALAIFLTYLFIKQSKKIAFIMLFTSLLGVGLSFIRPTFTKERYQLLVTEVKDNYYIGSSSFEKLYVYEKLFASSSQPLLTDESCFPLLSVHFGDTVAVS